MNEYYGILSGIFLFSTLLFSGSSLAEPVVKHHSSHSSVHKHQSHKKQWIRMYGHDCYLTNRHNEYNQRIWMCE